MITILKLVQSCVGLEENFQGISKLKKNPTKKYLTSFFCLYKFANKIVLFKKALQFNNVIYFVTTNKMM
jgi:hypothetical protein